MASTTFSGIHLVCSFAGANQNQLDVLRKPEWAHSMSVAGQSTYTAPNASAKYGEPTFKARALTNDIWLTIGASPDDPTVATSKREFIAAGEEKLFAVAAGDTFRWAVAS